MNRSIPDQVIEEVRDRCNIVDLIQTFVPLKKAGSGSWKGLCPFHQERTPSFTVNENRQRFHCFGCGKGGDIFRFIMEWEKVDFPNAIHLLAARCGVVIPETPSPNSTPAETKARADRRERLYKINEMFASFYARQLQSNPDSPVARYFATRNLPADVTAKFQIGAAPDSWDMSLQYGKAMGFSEEELIESGIVIYNEERHRVYDRFRNRLIFSIWNEQGKVVGFSARTVEKDADGAKYVNSPETPVFKKSQLLYALPFARQAARERNFMILAEGQMDVIALHRAGWECAVAPQGTAFTVEQARILKRYTSQVALAFDADNAGQKAILRALEILLPLDFDVQIIRWPGGKDPDELFRNQGAKAIDEAVNNRMDILAFLQEYLAGMFDLNSAFGKSAALDRALEILSLINNPIARDIWVEKLCSLLSLRNDSVFSRLNRLNQRRQLPRYHHDSATGPANTQEVKEKTSDPRPRPVKLAEEQLLQLAVSSENLAREFAELVESQWISNTLTGRALNLVIALALEGEFAHLDAELTKLEAEDETEESELSRIMLSGKDLTPNGIRLAVDECVETLKNYNQQQQERSLLDALKQAGSEEERSALLSRLMESGEN